MENHSSKVVISKGKTKLAGFSNGTLSIQSNQLIIKDSEQTYLDIDLSEVKKTSFQFTLGYIYTKINGVKIVNFKTTDNSEAQANQEMSYWIEKLAAKGVKGRDSRKLYITIVIVLSILALIRILISLFNLLKIKG